MPRVLVDFHHLSLLRSLVMLFEDRLGMDLYRPVGTEWHQEGFWSIYDHPATVKQYLSLDQGYRPVDGTPPLNQLAKGDLPEQPDGVLYCFDPETPDKPTKACTLDYFKSVQFDYVVASVPQHITRFQELIRLHQPNAKLIVQVGNDWAMDLSGANILCSGIDMYPGNHTVTYHQEFNLEHFYPTPVPQSAVVSSFINNLQATGRGWDLFTYLEGATIGHLTWEALGGQCRDGCITGSDLLGEAMRASEWVYNVKPLGDGYGHVIHNAYAVGRPVIISRAHYQGKLASNLLVEGTCFDVDQYKMRELPQHLLELRQDHDRVARMGELAADRFRELVDFDHEEIAIRAWLADLR